MRNMIRERLAKISERLSETNLRELADAVWNSDRLGTISNFHATYRHVSAKLREGNVRARPFELPADGQTILGDWKMPLGWECTVGVLEIIDPFELRHKVLADRKKRPESVVAFSGGTPAGGITAPLIRIQNEAEIETKKAQLKGKFAYVSSDPRTVKKKLIDAGAVGVVSSWSPAERYMPSATAAVESWSDEPAGTGFYEGDTPFPAMMISPETGVELDVLFDRGAVRVRMVIEARHGTAQAPVTCGYIDASLQEEIVAICSTQRASANACASGAAVALEAMRAVQDAVTAGAVPPLKRALRALLSARGTGSIGFAAKNPGILRRAIAGINLESVGRVSEQSGATLRRIACPDAAPSVADTLLDILIEEHWASALPYATLERSPYAFVDNGYNDPKIAVPCPAIQGTDRLQGTSADTPANQFSIPALKAFAAITGAYFHILSTSTQKEALWLAHETVRRYGVRIENAAADCAGELHQVEAGQRGELLARTFDHMDYVKEVSEKALMSAKNFMLREERASGHLILLKYARHLRRLVDLEKRRLKELADCEPAELAGPAVPADLAGLRPYKKFIGTPTYAAVPIVERVLDGHVVADPREDALLHAACFWADGNRSVEEIARAVGHEFKRAVPESLWLHLRFMEKHGLLLLLKAGEAVPKPPKVPKAEEETGAAVPEGGAEAAAAEPLAESGALEAEAPGKAEAPAPVEEHSEAAAE